mmetsp:Transcript_31883/g.123733  ORF Transcript_31883/g.123733 Transcript_31883/m.123733 type:complete len:98 (+) Transcript_31883:141-434(+)
MGLVKKEKPQFPRRRERRTQNPGVFASLAGIPFGGAAARAMRQLKESQDADWRVSNPMLRALAVTDRYGHSSVDFFYSMANRISNAEPSTGVGIHNC